TIQGNSAGWRICRWKTGLYRSVAVIVDNEEDALAVKSRLGGEAQLILSPDEPGPCMSCISWRERGCRRGCGNARGIWKSWTISKVCA
ncbi:hypothetical protein, partial [uncultured Acetatifactor sp.]|uniref:hypothetical protein n=1 Tax=uncultured Acetatifactor sp. TaxID=1671927 RepID=UPI00261B72BC